MHRLRQARAWKMKCCRGVSFTRLFADDTSAGQTASRRCFNKPQLQLSKPLPGRTCMRERAVNKRASPAHHDTARALNMRKDHLPSVLKSPRSTTRPKSNMVRARSHPKPVASGEQMRTSALRSPTGVTVTRSPFCMKDAGGENDSADKAQVAWATFFLVRCERRHG